MFEPPPQWRELGRISEDLSFDKGPSTSFSIYFDKADNTPYVAFTVMAMAGDVCPLKCDFLGSHGGARNQQTDTDLAEWLALADRRQTRSAGYICA